MLELKETRDEHDSRMKAARSQAEQLQSELQRVQTVNMTLRETLMNEQNENEQLSRDLNQCKVQLHESTASSKTWHAQLIQMTGDRNRLLKTVETLDSQIKHLSACRRKDFSIVAESLSKTMEREVETLRVNMGIPAGESD